MRNKSDEYIQQQALEEQRKFNTKLLTALNNIVAELQSIDDKLAYMAQPMSPDELRKACAEHRLRTMMDEIWAKAMLGNENKDNLDPETVDVESMLDDITP